MCSTPAPAGRCERRRCASLRPSCARTASPRRTPTARYEIKDLAAGRYQLNASKGSFVQLQYGQSRPFEPGKPLEVANGQTIEKVDFSLPRGGIITGRILDEFGDPASDVQVMAMRYQYIQGRRQLTPVGRVGDDQRHRRVPRVRAASGAVLRVGHAAEASISTRRPTIDPATRRRTTRTARASPTPSASRLASARPSSDINFALSPTRLARVTGTAVDSERQAARRQHDHHDADIGRVHDEHGGRSDSTRRQLLDRQRRAGRLHDAGAQQHGRPGPGPRACSGEGHGRGRRHPRRQAHRRKVLDGRRAHHPSAGRHGHEHFAVFSCLRRPRRSKC